MGGYCSRPRLNQRILFMGLDAAGKTTILYQLKLGEVVTTIPTIGFNVETVVHDGVAITSWDVGSRDKMRPLMRHYFANTDGVAFVIDCNDRERLDDAIEFLETCVVKEEELADVEVMVLANKQDLPGAMSAKELEDKLRNKNYRLGHRSLYVMPCTATTMEGVHEAFTVFVEQLKLRSQGQGFTPGFKSFLNSPLKTEPQTGDITKSLPEDKVAASFSLKSLYLRPLEMLKSFLLY